MPYEQWVALMLCFKRQAAPTIWMDGDWRIGLDWTGGSRHIFRLSPESRPSLATSDDRQACFPRAPTRFARLHLPLGRGTIILISHSVNLLHLYIHYLTLSRWLCFIASLLSPSSPTWHWVKYYPMPPTRKKETSVEDKVGIVPSHGISIDLPSTGQGDGSRPANIRHMYVSLYMLSYYIHSW